MSDEKKNMADKAKKAAVIAATGASVVVGSLYASPDELINPKPLTMMEPANNEGIEETDVENQKKSLGQILKNWLNSLPVWLRVSVGLPLWFIGWILITVVRSIYLKTNFVYLLIAGLILFVILVLVGKIMFPRIPFKQFVNKYTITTLLITVGVLALCDYIFPQMWDEYEKYSRYVVLATVTICIACTIAQYYQRYYDTKLVVSDDKYTFEN